VSFLVDPWATDLAPFGVHIQTMRGYIRNGKLPVLRIACPRIREGRSVRRDGIEEVNKRAHIPFERISQVVEMTPEGL
jgi:predicted site-specific integrase-resolvase